MPSAVEERRTAMPEKEKNMKIAAYEVRPDEKPVIESLCKEYGIELVSTPANLDPTTANMAVGCDGVTTLGQSNYCNEVLDELQGYGVKVLASRCVGYNHMNCDYARSLGFRLCNGAYAPNGVAEYTVMAILMCIRKFKKALYNTNDNDFTLKGKMGRELRTMTVGVMGTGKIGYTVIKCLSGFGCRILANDVYQNDAVRQYAEYVDLDTLYRESDIITIHTPLLPETTGMINREALAKMKDGVVLIDNARGELVDIDAIIEGVETEKIGALFMDAFPGETGIIPRSPQRRYYQDPRHALLQAEVPAFLRERVSHPPHGVLYRGSRRVHGSLRHRQHPRDPDHR